MKYFLFTFLVFAFPAMAFASISITEVMYDLEGADSGYEWIEMYNSGGVISIEDLILKEGGVSHGIYEHGSSGSIFSGSTYAVIADNPVFFKEKNPTYTGLLFDSSFSLSNTGELIEMLNTDGSSYDALSYSNSMGAQGDGKSLQNENGVWRALTPNPGEGFETPSSQASESSSVAIVGVRATPVKVEDKKPILEKSNSLSLDIHLPKTIVSSVEFNARASGKDRSGDILNGGEYTWNMGDGNVYTGKDVTHAYRYEGMYRVVLHAEADGITDSIEKDIEVIRPDLVVEEVKYGPKGFIKIYNPTHKAIDISGWKIITHEEFMIPQFSTIAPNSSFIFAPRDFSITNNSPVILKAHEVVVAYFDPYEVEKEEVYIPEETVSEDVALFESDSAQSEASEMKEVSAEEIFPAPEDFVASARAATGDAGGDDSNPLSSIMLWILGIISLIGVTSAVILLAPRQEKVRSEIDEYDILD